MNNTESENRTEAADSLSSENNSKAATDKNINNEGTADVKKAAKKKKETPPEKAWRDMTKQEKKHEILTFLRDLAIICVIFFILNEFVFMLASIPTPSMENTLMVDDKIFASRLSVTFGTIERGDIIIFDFHEDGRDEYFIKRLIGLPGDTVVIKQGKIYINGSDTPLDEPYITNGWKSSDWKWNKGPHGNGGGGLKDPNEYTFNVPEGHYFFLGDNRDNSSDARYWKNTYIPEEDLVAKAIFTYMPFSRFGSCY